MIEFLTRELTSRLNSAPLMTQGVGWQVFEGFLKAGEALLMPGNVRELTKTAVSDGTLIATGLPTTPTKRHDPVIIDATEFSESELGLGGTLTGFGFSYRDVRLMKSSDLPPWLHSERPIQSARQRQIGDIIRAMYEASELPKLRKQQIPIVRANLQQAGINNLGSDKTLERLIRNALK